MGRKPLPEDKKRENTKIRIRKDLKDAAREKDLNFSKLMEEKLKEVLKMK